MASWRSARDAGTSLPADEQSELEDLIDSEVRGATQRAATINHVLGSWAPDFRCGQAVALGDNR